MLVVDAVHLKIEPQGEPPLFLELAAGRYLIGRGTECEVQVDHDDVSRRHALLVVDGEGAWVEDLGSSNGTFVDGVAAADRTGFALGQVLVLGQDAIRVEFADDPREASGVGRFKTQAGESVPADLFFSNYVFKSEIARGGMGTVLEAEDVNTGRTVAIKKMLLGTAATAEGQFRFQQEARVMGWLEHANIVPMHELGVNENGVPYYTMKRVRGVTLQAVLRGIRDGGEEMIADYPLRRLLTIFQKVCDGVAFAHSRGVVHRDLKPENVLVGAFGEVMLLDWGLAKVLPGSVLRNSVAGRIPDVLDVGDLPEEAGDDASRSGLFRTRDGAVIGTPNFMPPEQAEGRIADVDTRSDIFSLGGILYSILSLRPPVTGASVQEVLANMREGYIAPPVIYNKVQSARLPGGGAGEDRVIALRHCPGGLVPEALSRVAMRAMEKEPEDRYQDVGELQAEVEAWLNGRATLAEEAGMGRQFSLFFARHRRAAFAAVFVLLCGLVFLFQSVREERKSQAALNELRKGIPLIEADVRSLVTAGEFERALARLETLLVFLPDDAGYRLQRANLLQTLVRFEAAEEAYREAMDAGSDPVVVEAEIAACRELGAMVGPDGLGEEGYERLVAHLRSVKRFAEAKRVALAQDIDAPNEAAAALLEAFRSVLREQGADEELLAAVRVDGGRLTLDLRGRAVSDITPANGVPFEVMNLSGSSVADLRPLRGMPLSRLDLTDTQVVDLEPLSGMPLIELNLAGTSVVGLGQLAGARLESLDVSGTKVTDLSALRVDALKRLTISDTAVSDLEPLREAPLNRFAARGCGGLRDVKALQGMPLTHLDLSYTAVEDLSPLDGVRVRHADLSGIPATDFAVMRSWDLNAIWLHDTEFVDFSVFKEMALEDLHVARVPARDFAPLAGLPLKRVTLTGTAIVDLSPFFAMQLEHLDLSFTRVSDLKPLSRTTVHSLMLHGCNGVQDWTQLRQVNGLRRLSAPAATVPKNVLRSLRTAALLSAKGLALVRDATWRDAAQIEMFWKRYGRPTGLGSKQ